VVFVEISRGICQPAERIAERGHGLRSASMRTLGPPGFEPGTKAL
jgi:hypothetical protein